MTVDQKAYFTPQSLGALFESRIVKSRAVGLDGTRLDDFSKRLHQEVEIISRKSLNLTYKYTNFREKLIMKGAKSLPRQISIPTIRDRLALRAICNCLAELAPISRSRPPHSYIKSISEIIRHSKENLSFIRVDIRDFFPSLSHDILIEKLIQIGCEPFLINMIKGAITNPTGMLRFSDPRILGIPQGLSISNILSSIYMSSFDEEQNKRGLYFRYVDDILIIEPSYKVSQRFVDLYQALVTLHLVPHPLGRSGKTEITRILEGIDYLGYNIKTDKISVRDSSYRRMFFNINKVMTNYKYTKRIDRLTLKLNLRITGCIVDGKRKGWLMFFSQTGNVSQLKFLDK